MRSKRHKDPRVLGEPFRTFREMEILANRGRAFYCFFQHKIQSKTLEEIATEQHMTRQRVKELVEEAETKYGIKSEDFRGSNTE